MNTKEKILYEALTLFSTKGYDSVSVRDISRAVGIKESSLYNHFTNKQAIFDEILQYYASRGEDFFNQMRVTGEDKNFAVDQRTLEMYGKMSNEAFEAMSAPIFDFYFIDEINVKIRRMLTIEQYRSPEISKIFREVSFDSALEFQSKLFGALMDAGNFSRCDSYAMALAFFAPVFLLFYKFDNDEASLVEARTLFLRHIRNFNTVYG
ncbi:MAG: TetR/AcrR family transcriptional regulator, partial [Erysipelotrichaceae bacterium]